MKWFIDNINWIFDGIGVVVISSIVGLFFKRKHDNKLNQSIKSGNNSINVQGGRDVDVHIGGKKDE